MAKGSWICVLVAALVAVGAAVHAQFAVPISDNVFDGEMLLLAEEALEKRSVKELELEKGLAKELLIKFQAREGIMVTVRNEESGAWYGIVPTFSPEPRQVQLTPFRLEARPDGYPAVRQLGDEAISGNLGASIEVPLDARSVQVRLNRVFRGHFPKTPVSDPRGQNPWALQKLYGASGGGLCSLTCGPVTASATSVQMPCGTCQGGR